MRLCQAIPGLSTVEIFLNQQKKIALTPYGMFFRAAAGTTPSRVSHRAPKVGDTDQNPAFSAGFSAEFSAEFSRISMHLCRTNAHVIHLGSTILTSGIARMLCQLPLFQGAATGWCRLSLPRCLSRLCCRAKSTIQPKFSRMQRLIFSGTPHFGSAMLYARGSGLLRRAKK